VQVMWSQSSVRWCLLSKQIRPWELGWANQMLGTGSRRTCNGSALNWVVNPSHPSPISTRELTKQLTTRLC